MRGLRGPTALLGLARRMSRSDERGATLALVALSLVWIVGLTALVVDVGDGWLRRQTLVSATDAAALAAAQDLVDRPWDEQGACATAASYVSGNNPSADVTDCGVTPLGSGGRVTVGASEDLDGSFTDLAAGKSVASVSTAAWGPPVTVSRLRPFGLCYDGSAALRQLIDNPPSGPTWIEIDYVKDDPSACGGVLSAGNFVTIDFEGGTSTTEIRDWMLNGYPGQISFDQPTSSGCGSGVTCYQRPYASGAIQWELQSLVNRGPSILLPVFDYANFYQVHLVGLVRARLYAFELDGPPASWRIELKVDPGLVTGTCCGPPGILSGNKVIAICGVDPGAYGACEASAG